MSDRHDPLSPGRTAALIAPLIDRLRNGIARSIMARGDEIGGAFGIGDRAGVTMAILRNALPTRTVRRDELRTVLRYVPPEQVEAGIAEAVAGGLLDDDGVLRATALGRECLNRLYAIGSDVVAHLWSGHEVRVESLLGLTKRLLDAATETGGPAFAVMAPPYEPPGATAAMRLAEQLTPLRFYRFDAHIAAWEAEGLTVAEVQALGAGPLRDRIEEETNRLTAPPYAALDPAERVELLGGLGALPN